MRREAVSPPASTDLLRDQGASPVSPRRAPNTMKVLQLYAHLEDFLKILLQGYLKTIVS